MKSNQDDLEQLRQAALQDPRNGRLRYLLGAEMAQQRDYAGAVLELSAAIALDPFLHAARLQLGLLHLTRNEPQHMLTVLAPLEELQDDSPLKHFKRGLEALARDDLSSCLAALRHGIGLNTQNAALNRDMALIVERVQALVDDRSAQIGTGAERTDFSLYGLTRH